MYQILQEKIDTSNTESKNRKYCISFTPVSPLPPPPIVGLKTYAYDPKSLAILFIGLEAQCYTQHQMHVQNISKYLR